MRSLFRRGGSGHGEQDGCGGVDISLHVRTRFTKQQALLQVSLEYKNLEDALCILFSEKIYSRFRPAAPPSPRMPPNSLEHLLQSNAVVPAVAGVKTTFVYSLIR